VRNWREGALLLLFSEDGEIGGGVGEFLLLLALLELLYALLGSVGRDGLVAWWDFLRFGHVFVGLFFRDDHWRIWDHLFLLLFHCRACLCMEYLVLAHGLLVLNDHLNHA
jgi:hypothetical protein